MKPATLCDEVLRLKINIEVHFLKMGKLLYKIHQTDAWKGKWDSYHDFLDEVGIRPAAATKLKIVYFTYSEISPRKLAEAGVEKLYEARKLITGDNLEDIVDKAIILRRDDLRKMGNGEDDHDHIWGKERYARCERCPAFSRIK